MNTCRSQTRTGRNSLYRSREGVIFGVCRGLANYSEISVFWVRVAVIIGAIVTGFWPMVLIYIMAAIFMKPAPVVAPMDEEEWEFYNSYAADRKMALSRLKRRFDSLDRRARRIESVVTDREFDWDRRFRSGT